MVWAIKGFLQTVQGSNKYRFNKAIDIDFDDDSEFSGEIIQINTGVAYKAFKNVGFALQYNYFRVDVDVNDTDWMGTLKYRYSGPVLAIAVYF